MNLSDNDDMVISYTKNVPLEVTRSQVYAYIYNHHNHENITLYERSNLSEPYKYCKDDTRQQEYKKSASRSPPEM